MDWSNWILQKNIDITLEKIGVSREEYVKLLNKAHVSRLLDNDEFYDSHKGLLGYRPEENHPYYTADDAGKKKILSDMLDEHATFHSGRKFTQGKDLSKPDNDVFSDLHQDTEAKRPDASHPFYSADEQGRKNIWDSHVNKLNQIQDWEKQNKTGRPYHGQMREDEYFREQKAAEDAHNQAERAKWIKNRPWMKR